MEEHFTETFAALIEASGSITGFSGKQPDDAWEVYAEAAERLIARLQQLDQYANVKYAFEEGMPADIINYTQLLKQYEQPLTEVLGFQLSQLEFMEDNSWSGYKALYLQETREAIISETETISSILGSAP